LLTRAYQAFKVVKNNELNKRRLAQHSIGDYSLSLLLIWIEIETILKLLRYYEKMANGYPNNLSFINRNWLVLKNIYNANNNKYELVLGHKSTSLRKIRNEIVHNGLIMSKDEHNKYYEAAKWMRDMLLEQLQPQEVYLSRRRRLKN